MRDNSIYFVSQTARNEQPLLDPSVRYRCFHRAERLNQAGHIASVSAAVPFYRDPHLAYDTYVFHRPSIEVDDVAVTLAELRRAGKTLVADYDDLIFGDEAIALVSSAVRNHHLTPERAIRRFALNTEALRLFDRVTVSTEPLAGWVREYNPDAEVAVVPNFVPASLIDMHTRLGTARTRRPSGTIGYFAGTKSHDQDIKVATPALARVLRERPDFALLVVGPVSLPEELSSLPNVTIAPVTDYMRLPSLMRHCATVIAPLEESVFTACKSRVKFLEASLAGCRLVATPIPDMIAAGEGRLIAARSDDDWYEALSEPPSAAQFAPTAEVNFQALSAPQSDDAILQIG